MITITTELSRRLIQLGLLLFLMGLITGFAVHSLENPRMGLASHLEAVMNGMFLVVLGLIWEKLNLNRPWLLATFWLAIYGTFANWLATLMAAVWAAGASMPMAGLGNTGSPLQEMTIDFLLYSLSIAMIAVCLLALWGLSAGAGSKTDEPA